MKRLLKRGFKMRARRHQARKMEAKTNLTGLTIRSVPHYRISTCTAG